MTTTMTPVPTVVPDGYRLLVTGERILKGDIYCKGPGHSWKECHTSGGSWNENAYWPVARKLTTVTPSKTGGWTLMELVIGLAFISSFVLWCGLVYVAVHFILKFW